MNQRAEITCEPDARLLTIDDMVIVFSVAKGTIWKWVRDGRLPAIRFGSVVRFDPSDVLEFVQNGKTNGRR